MAEFCGDFILAIRNHYLAYGVSVNILKLRGKELICFMVLGYELSLNKNEVFCRNSI